MSQKIKESINQLEQKGFEKTIDSISEYSSNADLYFRRVKNNRFVVFNHYNKTEKENLQGFDCWLSTYESKKEIGKIPALNTEAVKLSFDFSKDWELLSDYFN